MHFIVLMMSIFLLIGIIRGILRIKDTKTSLKNYTDKLKGNIVREFSDIDIIIPVYNEQKIIKQSINNFLPLIEKGVRVTYVTTQKEESSPTTKELLRKYIAEYHLVGKCMIVDYPSKKGVMSHQLNFAIKQIKENRIICIYNVDSRIDIRTIEYILENKDILSEGVFQKYSFFSHKNENGVLINSAIAWQNRWTIGYEYPKALKEKNGKKWYNFNYVIGHGLIFTRRMYDKFGGFSEEEINEDNVLGYKLHLKNIRITPVPIFENADFASSLGIYLKQQSTWFNGPAYAFKYAYKYYQNEKNDLGNITLVSISNFKNALNWALLPIGLDICLIYLVVNSQILTFILFLLLVVIYATVLDFLSEKVLVSHGYLKKQNKASYFFDTCFLLGIHFVGPLITITKILFRKNSISNKYKTEKS